MNFLNKVLFLEKKFSEIDLFKMIKNNYKLSLNIYKRRTLKGKLKI